MKRRVPRMNDQESAAWLGLTSVFSLLPAALDRQLQRDSGLTHFEFVVLSGLQLSPEPTMRMTALAEASVSTLPRLSHVCGRLEKRGLIERSSCPEDRRATNVRLTTDGRRELIRSIPGHIATARRLVIDALTPEQLDALTDITTTITARLTQEPTP
ncbi:MarR family winged helix-turn-helix transcriptional regulator [Promicromonospora iranensis]|uniref:DNA-binding MarR family transcriptional regulator n=1 Tax=Promicromonospora iranensis TaxID=1105144 RepID=A0ABU2CKE7_9MICO|nr:MarR family transcriptional regulator [Promicromonospora iranensis]MDR7381805.1 DNA-binding MarR family transcriptional regulator [Promicromonospora iranensis]